MKVFTITEAAKILGLSRKTLYVRLKNPNYKDCFVVNLNKKHGFLFYKADCVEKELNEKVSSEETYKFTNYYYEVLEKIQDKKNLSINEAENFLKKQIRKRIKVYSKFKRFINCNIKKRKELEEFTKILKTIEESL
jgi:hypothetical protein